jgi:hypothetical protein
MVFLGDLHAGEAGTVKGRTDLRTWDFRETAISVKILAERASKKCSANGDGYALLVRYYLHEESFWSFTIRERRIFKKTNREFARRLEEVGFISRDGGAG